MPPAEKRFLRFNLITIFSLFAVIIAGGVVRSTGSGMGCPDWPKCFNQYIPPTDVSQLPEGYEAQYVEGRRKKNHRFANTIARFGYTELADQIRNDETILEHEEFNAAKTWTEYVNRLVGAITGFLLLLCAIFSFTYVRKSPSITIWSMLNVIAVGFQAWLGSIVVSTNLMPGIITAHMLIALVIVGISIYTYFKARYRTSEDLKVTEPHGWLKFLALLSLIILVAQVAIGTNVREAVDEIASSGVSIARGDWLVSIGGVFYLHRNLSYLLLLVVLLLFFFVRSGYGKGTEQIKFANILLILIGLQFLTGVILSYWAIPPFAQTTHLVLASLFFGAQYYLMLLLGKRILKS